MRSFSDTVPFTIGEMVFTPHSQVDKWDNEVSIISVTLPSRTFRMVHHSPKFSAFQKATIYAGNDKFLKFQSHWNDNDAMAHTAEIKTADGPFHIWWGDGDTSGISMPPGYPEMLTHEARELIREYNDQLQTLSIHEDNELSFILFVMQVIHINGDDELWLDKATWESMKPKQNLMRRRTTY